LLETISGSKDLCSNLETYQFMDIFCGNAIVC